ncbi:hypothetical protein QBC33DRAFT_549577 [Phialemonium atrogriseum]|uniref:ER membrane protein complex subunit 1 n=1 Tax=Phialemonium atrogriseum TaxID=1093897 RepID=A0AAJ0FHQ1_9PEZI|nr:uncharacterized protein QBC33DRAFT_549577 [Phialemonium atrogriseum]KAK1763618.1 hypothetical protein QBC33DRAFT_549577 [Phialemonium atrogriseum]
MLPPQLASLLLLALPTAVHAIFQDEVGHLDYHHELLGVPQRDTTFFHRPRRDDKASLLYTLSDVGVLGAINPSNGAVMWRQFLNDNITDGGGFVRSSDGENWICSALGHSVHAWDAISGRNRFWMDFAGEVKDLEIMEMTEKERKDVLALYDDGGATVLRRLNGKDGNVVWEFKETSKNVPLQVSTNLEKVFVVSLHGSPGAYNLRVSVLDTATGRRVDDIIVGAKGDVHSEAGVMFVGGNSAAPIVAWTDESRSKLRINVLGTKTRQEFPLEDDTVGVEFHAPHLPQSLPHFLVHSQTKTGNRASVYHIDLKSNAITKAYELPHLPGHGAFSTSSSGANVFFTRITEDEVLLTASTSHGILGRWPLSSGAREGSAVHGTSEVVKKSDDTYAIRSAAVTDADEWLMVRNGELAWTRPEGMAGGVAAAFAEIPESEDLAKTLEQEAHSNPLSAYIHRVGRHVNDLQHLPEYLRAVPQRLLSSILGTEITAKADKPFRDNFGFHKLVILATRRGRLYGLDTGANGRVLWSIKPFDIPAGEKWDVKGIHVEDQKGQATVWGANGEYVVVKADTGDVIETMPRGSRPIVQSTALVDSPSGPWLLPIGLGGEVGDILASQTPKETLVVRGVNGELKGLTFVTKGSQSSEVTSWVFSPPKSQKIINIATRPSHDPIASIGRVLGDRQVKYKYLNPNTVVVAAADDSASTLTVYLLDTVSGEILSLATHEGVDTGKPAECAIAENWFLCSFFGKYAIKDSPEQSLMGYQLVISDLYESDEPNDRGPLGDSANFSSTDPVDVPTGPVLPSVVSQSFVLAAPISALQVTQTRQGISTRQVLAYLPGTHGIIGLPRSLIEPRRPVGRDPTAAEVEEGLFKYAPVIEIDPKMVITHEWDVLGVQKIITSPAIVESTSLVFAFGVDVFGTRVAPSFLFDILGKGFNKVSLIATVLALTIGVVALGPIVRKKQINGLWQAPM